MAIKGNGQRIFILVIVAVFLLSSMAITGAVILDQLNKDKTTKKLQDQINAQKAIQDQLNQSKSTDTSKTDKTNDTKGNKLQGTKLSGFTPVAKVDKLQIIDTKVGTGAEAKSTDTVTAHYTGALAKDGTIFQSSYDAGQPATFPLSGVIKGWQDGVPGMKVGGERRLIIPAAEAYGANAQDGIPANSDLVFDIVLVKIGG